MNGTGGRIFGAGIRFRPGAAFGTGARVLARAGRGAAPPRGPRVAVGEAAGGKPSGAGVRPGRPVSARPLLCRSGVGRR